MSHRVVLRLSDYPSGIVQVACRRCGRAGEYTQAALADFYSPDIQLADLRVRLASGCPNLASAVDCGMNFVNLDEGHA